MWTKTGWLSWLASGNKSEVQAHSENELVLVILTLAICLNVGQFFNSWVFFFYHCSDMLSTHTIILKTNLIFLIATYYLYVCMYNFHCNKTQFFPFKLSSSPDSFINNAIATTVTPE